VASGPAAGPDQPRPPDQTSRAGAPARTVEPVRTAASFSEAATSSPAPYSSIRPAAEARPERIVTVAATARLAPLRPYCCIANAADTAGPAGSAMLIAERL
jgi:hypothetical protein